MNKILMRLAVLGMLLCCGAIAVADALPTTKFKTDEFSELDYPLAGAAFDLPRVWKYENGDNAEFAKPEFDDSKWKTTEVGKEFPGSEWRWYRVHFDLPQHLQGKNLLLDLGQISVYDEVFLNGEKVAHYGNKPPSLTYGASSVWRKYPIDKKYFRGGKNTLAVRVYLGYRGGLYDGDYTLQEITENVVVGRLGGKVEGKYALNYTVQDSANLNSFAPSSNLLIVPQLTQIFGDSTNSQVTVKISDHNGRVVAEDTQEIPIERGKWTSHLYHFKAPQTPGNYRGEITAATDGRTLWSKKVLLSVDKTPSLEFRPRVDAALSQWENREFPIHVSDVAMGHFGPRDLNENKELYDNLTETDARGGLTYGVQLMKSQGAPRLFLAGVRPVPQNANKVGKLHRAAGYPYDGLRDAWLYGFVRPNRAGDVTDFSVKSTSWAKRTYHYEYANNLWMDFSISAINPAWMATSNVQKLRVFEGMFKQHGIGLPTHLAYESNGKIKIVDAKKGIRGNDMSANWVLAWFNGGDGWEGFDTPYLFVLEKRPELVQSYADTALFFSAPDGKSVGTIQGMPLYGVALQSPDITTSWKTELPQDVVERCRYWSRVLVNAPDEVKRTAQVDYAKDQLTVRDEFTHLNIRDDWNTRGIKTTPVSPALSLAAHSGDVDIAFDKQPRDLHLATLHGPLLAVDDAEKVLFRVNGLLHYIREVRDVQRPNDADSKKIQEEFNALVKTGLEELKKHPWQKTYDNQELMPGRLQRIYTNLLLALPYLQPDLRDAVAKEIRTETEKYFLYGGVPGPELAPHLKEKFRDIPAITTVTNPVNGLKMDVASSMGGFGIDQPFWTSANTQMVWLYAETLNRFDWLKQHYPTLQRYFNLERNSHDWSICASWDSFGGLRVGNGLQEGSGKFAGDVAMARIAHQFGDKSTSDQAAYHAVMEAIGMVAQVSATDYLKQRRPWPAGNTEEVNITYAETLRPHFYAEFNEFKGFSQAVIKPQNLLNGTGSYILSPVPVSMRLYQEVWGEFTDDFYDPKYDAIMKNDRRSDTRTSMDIFVYMVNHYPQTKKQLFDFRKKLDLEWWDKLPDYRAYLDSKGKISYRGLW